MKKPIAALILSLLCLLGLNAQGKVAYSLSVIHVNDTHSKFEPSLTKLSLDIDEGLKARPLYLELGGFPYAAEVIAKLRSSEPNPVLVHGGDFFQGTLYYTRYAGQADMAVWNYIKPDIAILGNHEFDKGPEALREVFLKGADFPIVGANLDMSKEQSLKGLAPKPYWVISVGGQKIGFIGATTVETPFISSPGKSIGFSDPLGPIQAAQGALAKAGVNKVILVSHLGYDEDLRLAKLLRGVDVIVGAHSHTLLGDWKPLGLAPLGDYPSVVRDASGDTCLVVQAWEWAKIIGDLKVDFDDRGRVVSYLAKPRLVAGNSLVQAYELPDAAGKMARVRWQWNGFSLTTSLYDGKAWQEAPKDSLEYWGGMYDRVGKALLSHPEISLVGGDDQVWGISRGYARGVQAFQREVVASVSEDLKRGLNSGPGPIIADSMRAYTGTQIGLTNVGGVRTDLLTGPLSTAGVYEVIPFGNTLVTLKASGAQILAILEDGIDFGLGKYGSFPSNPLIYVSGLSLKVKPSKAKGSRIVEAKIILADGSSAPLDPLASYTMTVNNFIAAGGDKYEALAAIPDKKDTGYIDAEAFFAFVKGRSLGNVESRVKIEE